MLDYQVQLPNGTVIGNGTSVGLLGISGLRSLPGLHANDLDKAQADGSSPGTSYLSERPVGFQFRISSPPGGLEAAVASVSASWQNIKDPSSVAMVGGDYLTQQATGGSKPVSALQVQLPGRPAPLFLLGKPTKFDLPIDVDYQYQFVVVSTEWTVPDGVLYDAGVVASPAIGLPTSVAGAAFPAPFPISFGASSGGSATITNGGTYDAKPVFQFTGPLIRPRVTNGSTGDFIQLNLTLGVGDVVTVDTQSKVVRLNGVNRNNTVDIGTTFFSLPSGPTTVQLTSGDGAPTTGTLTAYLLNTYSVV